MAKFVRVEIKMLSLILVTGSRLGHLLGEGCMGQRLDLQIFTCVYGFVPDAIVVKSHIIKRIQTVLISLVLSLIISTIVV